MRLVDVRGMVVQEVVLGCEVRNCWHLESYATRTARNTLSLIKGLRVGSSRPVTLKSSWCDSQATLELALR